MVSYNSWWNNNWNKSTISNTSLSFKYFVQICTNQSTPVVFSTNIRTNTSFVFAGVENGKTYYARVCGTNYYNKGDFSGWSDGITIDTTPPTLSGPPLDEGKWNTNGNIVFHWVKAVDNESGVLNYSLVISTNTNIGGTVFSNNSLTIYNETAIPQNVIDQLSLDYEFQTIKSGVYPVKDNIDFTKIEEIYFLNEIWSRMSIEEPIKFE